jgi:hypothetical protein
LRMMRARISVMSLLRERFPELATQMARSAADE